MAKIIQLKIYLKEMPEIWRRFLVSDFWTFDKLHRIIQKVMGWENYHLFEFKFSNLRIVPPDEGFLEENEKDPKKVRIHEYVDSERQKFEYVYDFGDSWEHEIIVEKMMEDRIEDADKYPCCMGGEKACPPEDCGGVEGYQEMLKIKKNKNHPRYKELIIGWLGEDFDSEKFDIDEVNKNL